MCCLPQLSAARARRPTLRRTAPVTDQPPHSSARTPVGQHTPTWSTAPPPERATSPSSWSPSACDGRLVYLERIPAPTSALNGRSRQIERPWSAAMTMCQDKSLEFRKVRLFDASADTIPRSLRDQHYSEADARDALLR